MMRRPNAAGDAGFWILGGVILLIIVICLAVNFLTRDSVSFTVRDKQTKLECTGSGEDRDCKDVYLIYTDKGTFKNTDNALFFKFSSSDLYGKLERGHVYNCEVNGFRIPVFSTYKNLLNCKEAHS